MPATDDLHKRKEADARRGDGSYLRLSWTLLEALLVAVGAVTAFWWFVP